MEPIRLSVRRVTDHILRCGDIDSRFVESDVMWAGAKAHRKLQKEMGDNYQKEVSLKLATDIDGIPAILQGRADGVILEEDLVTIDEIKTTTLPLEIFWQQRELHLGQGRCYAHMLLETMESPPDRAAVQLTYYQLDTQELQRHTFEYTRRELADWFRDLMYKYGVWLRLERDWKETRDTSIKATDFPYPAYRRGQRELAVSVYRTIERRGKLYAQAPTGIGKTLSALFPTVKAIGEGKAEKIFYLTAKTVTRAVAEDAVRQMAARGLRFKSVTLRAKDKICFCEETICNADSCPYAKGHYDRVNEALLDLLGGDDLVTPDVVCEYARKHRVCPHELALDTALWTDLVICDYNHVFDPVAYLRRFFAEEGMGEYVFLIDEAHNLVERVRDMYSAPLQLSDFTRLKRSLKDKNANARRFRKAMGEVSACFQDMREQLGEHPHRVEDTVPDSLLDKVRRFEEAAGEWLSAEKQNAHPLQKEVLELYFATGFFAGISEIYDERYATITERKGRNLEVTLFCLDPSVIVAQKLRRAVASALFSATLTPLDYYREILGGGEEDRLLALPSPFDQERLLLAAHYGISTRYADRPMSIAPIAEAIYQSVTAKRGNYLCFFPSYAYLDQVYQCFTDRYPVIPTLKQQTSMDEDQRALFLERFSADATESLVGFCVMGGIFSEGIDLKGERLIGAIIVGVGLPGVCLRQDLIRDYFDQTKGAGYDYAYVYPGMNKVLQAAGRVIRSEEDYGLVLLIDSRFATAKYRRLYPAHWSGMRYVQKEEDWARLLEGFPSFQKEAMDTQPNEK